MRSILSLNALLALSLAVSAAAQTDGSGQMGAQGGARAPGRFGGQRVQGTVTAVSSGAVTVKTEAGDVYTVTLADNARMMRSGQPIQMSAIQVGDSVTAFGTIDAAKKTAQAAMLMDVDAATVARAKENLGKTYITGRLTAVDTDNLKLTVMRPDGVSQTIAVDEGTSFQRGMRGVAQEVQAAGGMAMGAGFGGGRGMGRRQGESGTPPAPESITLATFMSATR